MALMSLLALPVVVLASVAASVVVFVPPLSADLVSPVALSVAVGLPLHANSVLSAELFVD